MTKLLWYLYQFTEYNILFPIEDFSLLLGYGLQSRFI